MKTVFTKEWKTDKYYIQEFAWRFRVTCQILNYVSQFYPSEAFDTLEEAKEYGESFLKYLEAWNSETWNDDF